MCYKLRGFNQGTNKKQKCELKRFPIFLLALCFFPFICLYSECFSKQFYAILIPSFEDYASTNYCSQKRRGKVNLPNVTKVVISIKTSTHRQTIISAYI